MWLRLLLIRVLALVALGVSTSQLADHISGAGAFCDFGDSCEQVTSSVYGLPLGIPLSAIGLAGFTVLFALTLVPARWAQVLVRVGSAAAGLAGIALLAIQFAVLHKLCPLCAVVDIAAIGTAVAAAGRFPEPAVPSRFQVLGWIVAPAAVALIPVCWTAAVLPDPVPQLVKDQWIPGEVTIVDVTDFECPHCQKADALLREVMSRHKIHLVRLACPMPIHENAVPAARAFIAARELGKGDEMASALFAADNRAAPHCREIAAGLGLNLNDYDRLLKDASTDEEYMRMQHWLKTLGKGLPLIWVQDQAFDVTPTVEKLEDAIRKARP